jgi:NitT/TauT family transport system permease protein
MEYRYPRFFGLVAKPSKGLRIFLSIVPFVVLIAVYLLASHLRHRENPQDKLLPTPSQMVGAVKQMAFEEDSRTGHYLMWKHTGSSLKRIFIGVAVAALLGLFFGITMGLFPGVEALSASFTTVLSIIPPLAVLPILFLALGVDEFAKIVLIFVGTFPLICRDMYLTVKKVPAEQIVKSMTLGAGALRTAYSIVMPQMIPRLLDTTRLSFGGAWLFLIAAEAIASTDGLGYRIFLVRRYLAMDVIIPYVMWITFLGFLIDWCLRRFIHFRYPWYAERES